MMTVGEMPQMPNGQAPGMNGEMPQMPGGQAPGMNGGQAGGFGGGQFPGRVSHSGADRDARPAGGDRKALFNKAFFGRGVVDIRIRLFEYAVILPLIDRPFVMCRGNQNLSSTWFPDTLCSRIIEIGHE